jgi:hypothetical protein
MRTELLLSYVSNEIVSLNLFKYLGLRFDKPHPLGSEELTSFLVDKNSSAFEFCVYFESIIIRYIEFYKMNMCSRCFERAVYISV